MRALSMFAKMFSAKSRLYSIERKLLQCVRNKLAPDMAEVWDKQIAAIAKVERLPDGVGVDLFFANDEVTPAFPNRTHELLLAKVLIELPEFQATLSGEVWAVEGYLFSIKYLGSINSYEEALGSDPAPMLKLDCELIADLGATVQR